MKTVAWILSCYPRRWRERYQEEMLALLEEYTITWKTLFDLLLGALDARLDPTYRSREGFVLHGWHDIRLLSYVYISALTFFLVAINCWALSVDTSSYFLNSYQSIGSPLIHEIPMGLTIAGPIIFLLLSLIPLAINTYSIVSKALKNRSIGILLFAVLCILVTFWVFSMLFALASALPALLILALPIGMALFLGGIKVFKLLQARQFVPIIFTLLSCVIAPVSLILYEIVGLREVSDTPSLWGQLLPYFAIGMLIILLSDAPLDKQNWRMIRRIGIAVTLFIAIESAVVMFWDISCWIAGAQSNWISFDADGFGVLIVNAIVLISMLALVLVALIRSFSVTADPAPRDIVLEQMVTNKQA